MEASLFEKLARGRGGLAGAQAEPFRCGLGRSVAIAAQTRLRAEDPASGLNLSLDLNLRPRPDSQGDQVSRKGPEPGRVDQRQRAGIRHRGTVTVGGEAFTVDGLSLDGS